MDDGTAVGRGLVQTLKHPCRLTYFQRSRFSYAGDKLCEMEDGEGRFMLRWTIPEGDNPMFSMGKMCTVFGGYKTWMHLYDTFWERR